MKLKEKLAKESHDNWIKSDDCELVCDEFWSKAYKDPYNAAFIAGFEKALELATDRAKLVASYLTEDVNSGDISMRECGYAQHVLIGYSRDVKKLGEEEV